MIRYIKAGQKLCDQSSFSCSMKVLIVLALVACAQALPTPQNATLTAADGGRSFGFASFGSGTVGGAGGAVWNVHDAWALRDAISGNSARVVYVHGYIDLTQLFVASPGVVLDVGSRKTIIGVRATITGGGFRIKNNNQVIIQHIKFLNALSFAPGERPNGSGGITNQGSGAFTDVDAILLETATYVWIDHNEFADDPWISNNIANNRMRHDGLVDIKRASNYVTVSNNIFRNHNKCMLVGHSDSNGSQDKGKLKTSLVANWFQGTKQRNPRVRYAEMHILNNLYTDMGTYGIGVGAGASLIAERNVFIRSRAWRHPDGTPNPMGYLRNTVNQLNSGSTFDPVPNNVSWNPGNYFSYQSLAIGNVEAHVRRTAGVRN